MTTTRKAQSPVRVNGFVVLAYRPVDEVAGYVLVDRGVDGPADRFVTWNVATDGRDWFAYAGHYFTDLRAALDDVDAR